MSHIEDISMHISNTVRKILKNYESSSISLRMNLARILSHGKLKGTGKMMIFAVDQGFEHGPDKMFAINPKAYDPHYIFHIASKYGLNALAAPLGILQSGVETFFGKVPLILKLNSSNLLAKKNASNPDQAVTASVKDALRLGCAGVGFTIYPGSESFLNQLEELKDVITQARAYGLVVIVWSYIRGNLPKEEELALDLITYGAHMACLMGAHIVKVKIPKDQLHLRDAAEQIIKHNMPIKKTSDRIRHVVRGCFDNRRMVIFSGGETKNSASLIQDTKDIIDGGGHGSIIGRNFFQRDELETKELIQNMQSLYLEKKV